MFWVRKNLRANLINFSQRLKFYALKNRSNIKWNYARNLPNLYAKSGRKFSLKFVFDLVYKFNFTREMASLAKILLKFKLNQVQISDEKSLSQNAFVNTSRQFSLVKICLWFATIKTRIKLNLRLYRIMAFKFCKYYLAKFGPQKQQVLNF